MPTQNNVINNVARGGGVVVGTGVTGKGVGEDQQQLLQCLPVLLSFLALPLSLQQPRQARSQLHLKRRGTARARTGRHW